MKKMLSMAIVGCVLASAQAASADDPFDFFLSAPFGSRIDLPASFQAEPPAPAPASESYATSEPMSVQESVAAPMALYHCVRYKDCDDKHPCAVPMIVSIVDPCACHDPCSCCAPACVQVQICVPPCGCPKIKRSRNGHKVEYDYGKYEIELKSKDGVVTVEYDD
jgi:hypothetical protein